MMHAKEYELSKFIRIFIFKHLNLFFQDSGGPLTENVGGAGAMVVGVVSWGYFCAREYPTVYARTSYYLDWIRNHM